jgi:hypothetical protein
MGSFSVPRDLIRAHGGCVGVLPAFRGARFRVVLPMRAEAEILGTA